MSHAKSVAKLGVLLVWVAASVGCSHPMQIKNLEMYAVPVLLGGGGEPTRIAITPFSGTPDELWYHNALVSGLARDPMFSNVQTDYIPRLAKNDETKPDILLSIKPRVNYRSSGWNFLINWPGFLIFTPAWNGYVYRADVMSVFQLQSVDGETLDHLEVPMTYSMRHADSDRTTVAELSWFEVSSMAFFGGIYNANVFDRDAIAPFHSQAKDNYATYVLAQARTRIRNAATSVRAKREQAAEVEADDTESVDE